MDRTCSYDIDVQFSDGDEYCTKFQAGAVEALVIFENMMEDFEATGKPVAAAWLSHGEHIVTSHRA